MFGRGGGARGGGFASENRAGFGAGRNENTPSTFGANNQQGFGSRAPTTQSSGFNGGGFGSQRTENGGGFGSQRTENGGGGFGSQRNENGGSFGSQRNENGGGFGSRASQGFGGGFAAQRNEGFGNQRSSGFGNNFGSRNDVPSFGGGGSVYPRSTGFAGENLRPVDWKQSQLQELKKDIYSESAAIKNRNQSEIDAWLQSNEVTLDGNCIPRPVFEFNEAGYPQKIVDLLYNNYERPTVIQSISWPVALSGRDMISIAKTGSGKTLGFLLPGIMHTLSQAKRQSGEGPSVLIMLPTRELAQQVQDVAKDYCTVMGMSFTCLYGGSPKPPQASECRRGIDVCVATPGRLLDFMEAGIITMARCSFLVLDEADRMLDMGFEPQIRRIVSQIRPDRQTLMFSATWPKAIRQLARDFQKDPVFLNVGSLELAANHNIEQIIEIVEESNKEQRLYQILDDLLNEEDAKILVFVETKRKADDLTGKMRHGGWPALCIHGDKEQRERNWVLAEFKSGNTPVLLATDVAARGLDVDNIKHVINFDFPNNSEDYVHRIGRTGRRDKKGVAYTFFTSANSPKARDLIKVLEEANQKVPNDLRYMADSGDANSFGGNRRFGGGGRGAMNYRSRGFY